MFFERAGQANFVGLSGRCSQIRKDLLGFLSYTLPKEQNMLLIGVANAPLFIGVHSWLAFNGAVRHNAYLASNAIPSKVANPPGVQDAGVESVTIIVVQVIAGASPRYCEYDDKIRHQKEDVFTTSIILFLQGDGIVLTCFIGPRRPWRRYARSFQRLEHSAQVISHNPVHNPLR